LAEQQNNRSAEQQKSSAAVCWSTDQKKWFLRRITTGD